MVSDSYSGNCCFNCFCNVLQLPQGQSQTHPEEERPCLSEILTVKSALLLFRLFVLQFVAG